MIMAASEHVVLSLYRAFLREGLLAHSLMIRYRLIHVHNLKWNARGVMWLVQFHTNKNAQCDFETSHSPSLPSSNSPPTSSVPLGRKFPNYNISHYVKRRAAEGFREQRGLSDPDQVARAVAQAREALTALHRQSIVYSLYMRWDVLNSLYSRSLPSFQHPDR